MNIRSIYGKNEQQFTLDFFDYECNQCLKVFASEYGLYSHRNMQHPNQSTFCTECNLTFRSHRALKNHQQRFHGLSSEHLFNNHRFSYLVVPFSTEQFSLITSNACEQNRLQLGEFSSKLFQCQFCSLSFPTFNGLRYHRLHQHEQYQYDLCQKILDEMIVEIEDNLRTVDSDDREFQSMRFLLAKQASCLGLMDKQSARRTRAVKDERYRLIFPSCEHPHRTCANLCLQNLSSYHNLLRNYPYQIPCEPKGNPFAQGSIVSKPLVLAKENLSTNHKRSPQSKRKLPEQSSPSSDLISPKKLLLKINHNYTRSLSSMSSTSSTSTRSSSKNSRPQSKPRLKRSASPSIILAVERSSEKRRRQREQRKAKSSSSTHIKLSNDIEQENDDDDIISIRSSKPKQRQASNSSVEYIQEINHDQSSISSLNNIENLKLKSPSNDQDIILCHSTPSINGIHKIKNHQTTDYDEHIRVRCKICGEILDGRSRFSKHVLTKHSHVIKTTLSEMKQQPPTPIVYSV